MRSGSILRARMNRPAKKNAMTSAMYTAIADLLNDADKDDDIRVAVLHGAGDLFTAGNDLVDFQKNPPEAGDSPQARFTEALINFSKPLIAAVHGAAVGSGTTMLLHFYFVYAAENTKFQMPFVNLALVPELGRAICSPLRPDTLRRLKSFCWDRHSMLAELWSWDWCRGIAFDILGVQEGLAEAGEQDSNHGIERGGGPWTYFLRALRIWRIRATITPVTISSNCW